MIGGFILAALFGYYLLDSLAKILNLSNLTLKIPPEFEDVYDEYRYHRSQQYTRTNTWFEIIASTVSLAILIAFWFMGGFAALDQWVRTFHLNAIMTGLLYLGVLGIAHEVFSLPFEIYQTFVIEQQYGFNRTRLGTFIVDRLRDWTISGILATGFLAVVLALFERFGVNAWIAAWLL